MALTMHSNRRTGLILGVCIALAACRAKQPPPQAPLEEIFGSIDTPSPGRLLNGESVIAGWVSTKTGVERMGLYIDRQFVNFVPAVGTLPPDAGARPGESSKIAWSITVQPSGLTEGEHEILLQVRARSGAVQTIGPRAFKWRTSTRSAAYEIPLEPIFGNLDSPRPGDAVHGSFVVGGWCIAETGVQRVAIYMDGQLVRFQSPGEKRDDVAKLFSAFPDAGNSGWTTIFNSATLSDGEHQLVAQVKARSGAVRNLGPVTFRVTR